MAKLGVALIVKAQNKEKDGYPWREGVGVEPTQDLSQPHTGFEDQ
jgi:hypothetical protein